MANEAPGLTPGTLVRYWPDYSAPGRKAYPNYQIVCAQCAPAECKRTRGDLVEFKKSSGEIEPLAYLHVWERTPAREGKAHNRTGPKQADVVIFAETHREELTALRDQLRDGLG